MSLILALNAYCGPVSDFYFFYCYLFQVVAEAFREAVCENGKNLRLLPLSCLSNSSYSKMM